MPAKVLPKPVSPTKDYSAKEKHHPVKPVVGKQPPTPKRQTATKKRLYVLDTNVFMHDPSCIFRFEEHDIYITSMVFEELDNNKSGDREKSRNAREVSRKIEQITSSKTVNLSEGAPLLAFSGGHATGRLFMQMEELPDDGKVTKPDNQILRMVTHLTKLHEGKCQVVLVSKDTNMRIKARARKLAVEDYQNDMVKSVEDTDFLPSGFSQLPPNFWDNHEPEARKEGSKTFYKITGPQSKKLVPNEFVFTSGEKPLVGRVIEKKGNLVTLEVPTDYTHEKNNVFGVTARNKEQNFALNLLLDPDVDLVTMVGAAGSGKTLLALAAAFMQTINQKTYTGIIVTRATVSIGDDIGFLPGTESDKMGAWMGALDDNLEVLESVASNEDHAEKKHSHSTIGHAYATAKSKKAKVPDASELLKLEDKKALGELLREKMKIKSLNFMRGRTFFRKYVIIDEAQNLTPKQMQTLITRAGPGTKMVIMGNLAQIDTPYLTEGASGLTYVVTKFQGWQRYGHIILQKGERSLLATEANERLK